MLNRKLTLMVALGYLAYRVMARRASSGNGAQRPVARSAGAREEKRPRFREDMVDERAEQSFPASDPPGTY